MVTQQLAPTAAAARLQVAPTSPSPRLADEPDRPKPLPADEQGLLEALLRGDEAAFVHLVERYHSSFVRLARAYVGEVIAEEVAQEAWLGILRGLHQFAGRASLKTWMYRILINGAKRRALRERQSLPFSAVWETTSEPFEPAVGADRFRGPGDAWPGGWVSCPQSWGEAPEERLLSKEVRNQIERAIDGLPPSQRSVVLLRDVQGLSAAEVCAALQVSEANQRVLLHRGRSRVRRVLEAYLGRPSEA